MKIIIKKNNKNFLEEARTFKDATTNVGKYKKKLINKLRTLEKEQPEQLADEIIENMKNSIEEKYEVQGKNYTLPDGERVSVFDWLKNLTINNTNNLIEMLSKGELDENIKSVIAHFILSKKFTPVKSVSELENLTQLDDVVSNSWWQWKADEERKREKESLKSDKQNIEELLSPNQNWEILIPHDKQAAIYLGQICRSKWCTSARSSDNMFNNYYKANDPMFVIKHKTSKETAEVKNPQTLKIEKISVPIMFQIHFGTQQFMDRKDQELDEGVLLILLKLIKNSKTADGKPVEEKYPVVNRISLNKTEKGIEKKIIDEYGTTTWYLNGRRHREDGPAVEAADGLKEWWLNGKLHREDGPAVEKANGMKKWYIDNKLHREDGPAIEAADGLKNWWLNGKVHREDGPAFIQPDGSKKWLLNDRFIEQTDKNDVSTPPEFIRAGGKEWDWQNDPWFDKSNPRLPFTGSSFVGADAPEGYDINDHLEEHFRRFRKLWL